MTTRGSMFELAAELRDEGQLEDSINVLSRILDQYPVDKKIYLVFTVLGGLYRDLGENDKALLNFEKAAELNPGYELGSLGKYVTLVKLDRDIEAINELIRYLSLYPAKLYKDTLEELLEGFQDGYMTNYRDIIMSFAKKNGVEI